MPDFLGDISLAKAIFRKYLKEICCSKELLQIYCDFIICSKVILPNVKGLKTLVKKISRNEWG